MPKADRKDQPKVSELEKSENYEICKCCGELIPHGSRCPTCGLTYEENESKFSKYVKSS